MHLCFIQSAFIFVILRCVRSAKSFDSCDDSLSDDNVGVLSFAFCRFCVELACCCDSVDCELLSLLVCELYVSLL